MTGTRTEGTCPGPQADPLGDQAFKLVDAFTGKAGEARLTYESAGARTLVELHTDKDADVEFSFTVNGDLTGGASFVL